MTIATFLKQAAATLHAAGILTARLDAQVLASFALSKDRSWLLAHDEQELTAQQLDKLNALVSRRTARQPIAYLRGTQPFYGRIFDVTPDVLIPRPETETIIELIKKYVPHGKILDVGTGSGAIAVTLALEMPNLQIEACDISPAALAIARQNTTKLEASVHFFVSDLLRTASGPYDAIVANLPYVARDWQRSPETDAEPALALFANDDGLALIKQLIKQVPDKLHQGGYLFLEADPRQHTSIEKAARTYGFVRVAAEGFGLVFAPGKPAT